MASCPSTAHQTASFNCESVQLLLSNTVLRFTRPGSRHRESWLAENFSMPTDCREAASGTVRQLPAKRDGTSVASKSFSVGKK